MVEDTVNININVNPVIDERSGSATGINNSTGVIDEQQEFKQNVTHHNSTLERYGGFHEVVHELHRHSGLDNPESGEAINALYELYDAFNEYIDYLESIIEI